MKWILLFVVFGGHSNGPQTSGSAEFDSELGCRAAAEKLDKEIRSLNRSAYQQFLKWTCAKK